MSQTRTSKELVRRLIKLLDVKPGEDHESAFTVARDLDGGSFSNRRVVASQQGRPILNLTASFHRRESGLWHQDEMPQVPPPEDRRAMMLAPRPIELRPVEKRHWMGGRSD